MTIPSDDEPRSEPFRFQPDPERPFFVQPKAEKLVRRGPREYYIVGRRPDGSAIETRLSAVSFRMEGLT
jgi:hypothetical protein